MNTSDEFLKYCVEVTTRNGIGFLYSLDGVDWLVLRDSPSTLATWIVRSKKHDTSDFPRNILLFKRVCDLVFGYMSRPTQSTQLLCEDDWPEAPITEKRQKRTISVSSDNANEIDKKRIVVTKNEEPDVMTKEEEPNVGADAQTTDTATNQQYRYDVNKRRITQMRDVQKKLIQDLAPDMESDAIIAWGVLEGDLEYTQNPFRYLPLLPHGVTLREWFSKIVRGRSVDTMLTDFQNHKVFICGDIIYEQRDYVVAKRDQECMPLVHLTSLTERPSYKNPEPFLLAAFFNLYAGGTLPAKKGPSEHKVFLQTCLCEPVRVVLMAEPDQNDALARYKRVLLEVSGRTCAKTHTIIEQFNSIDDMNRYLVVDEVQLKFDIPTVYKHPVTEKEIKFALDSSTGRVLSRWTNVVGNARRKGFYQQTTLVKGLQIDSCYYHKDVIDALTIEGDISMGKLLPLLCDVEFVLSENQVNETLKADRFSGSLFDFKKAKGFIQQLQLEKRCEEYILVGETVTEKHKIVYGDLKFHIVAVDISSEGKGLVDKLNTSSHLRAVQACPLMVADLYGIDLTVFSYLNNATQNKLFIYRHLIEFLQSTEDKLLHDILRDAFCEGLWKQTHVEKDLWETLLTSMTQPGGYITEFAHLFQKPTQSIIPLYLETNTKQLIHCRIKDLSFTVYKFTTAFSLEKYSTNSDVLNNLDIEALLASDLALNKYLVVYMINLAYKKREKNSVVYGKGLKEFKRDMFRYTKYFYNINITGATAFGTFDDSIGEDMLTNLLESKVFCKREPCAFEERLDAIEEFKKYKGDRKILYLEDNCVMFMKELSPILFVYNGNRAHDILKTIMFDMWLGSSRNNDIGFVLLPTRPFDQSGMEVDDPKLPSHALTLVASNEFPYQIPMTNITYGAVDGTLDTFFPSGLQMLLTWCRNINLINDELVSYCVSHHAMCVMKFGIGAKDRRLFDPSFLRSDQLNNVVSNNIPQTIFDTLRCHANKKFAFLRLSREEFQQLFQLKNVKKVS